MGHTHPTTGSKIRRRAKEKEKHHNLGALRRRQFPKWQALCLRRPQAPHPKNGSPQFYSDLCFFSRAVRGALQTLSQPMGMDLFDDAGGEGRARQRGGLLGVGNEWPWSRG